MLNKDKLKGDLVNLGIKSGDILNVKASLKSIGLIEGGAKTLLESILEVVGPDGTIVSEAFIKTYPVIQLRKKGKYISTPDSISYAGAFVNEMMKHSLSFRSSHPIQRFVAIGKDAEELMTNYSKPDSIPYEVLKILIDRHAKNLRIGPLTKVVGVGTTHLAIDDLCIRQKRLPYGVYYYDNSQLKKFIPNWPSGCSASFNSLFPAYRKEGAIISEGKIGEADSMITDMKRTYNIEIELFKKDVKYTMCSNPGCAKCRIGWEHSKGQFFSTLFYNIKKRDTKRLIQTVLYQFTNNYQPK